MKLINRTRYLTSSLRRFFAAGLAAMGAETDKVIYVYEGGRRKISRACYPSLALQGKTIWMIVEYAVRYDLPGNPREARWGRFARVFEHEVSHNLGLKHAEMDRDLRYAQGEIPEWAKPMIPIAERPRPAPVDKVAHREEHARKMLERAERRLKITQGVVHRWRRKVLYYDRKTAASPASREV